jgi:hypothetical protein
MRTLRLAILPMLLLALCACATTPTSSIDVFAQRSAANSFEMLDRAVEPPQTLVLPVKHDRQTSGAACGAHALASVINYWNGDGAAEGQTIFASTPPSDPSGYSMAELMSMARANGLTTSAVRLREEDIIHELESGRPVLVPVRLPSIYIQHWQLPGANVPVLGLPAALVTSRVGMVAELTGASMVQHYLLLVGYEDDKFVALEPVMGFRTISFDRLERYRRPFQNAALVFSGSAPPAAQSAGRDDTEEGAAVS